MRGILMTAGRMSLAAGRSIRYGNDQSSPDMQILRQHLNSATPSATSDALFRQRVIGLARTQLGVREGSQRNRGVEVDTYRGSSTSSDGAWPQPWCASFVSWVFNECNAPLVDSDGDTWSARIGDWARSKGRLRGPDARPTPGDLVLVRNDLGAARWANHIGIVSANLGADLLLTVEGNVRDSVVERVRDRSDVVGFVDVSGLARDSDPRSKPAGGRA